MKSSGGEIIQVQGGHIVRSTGRKDRHSKVFTAKGTRDRRVRLSAHTAIQFYDVQDRLGYDRPSKAVDWLIKKAKTAIDKLAELPPWNPTAAAAGGPDANAGLEAEAEAEDPGAGSNEMSIAEQGGYNFQVQNQQLVDAPQTPSSNNNSGFVGSSMDPDPMKSLFPSSYRVEDLGLSLHPFQNQSLIHSQPHQGNTSHSVSSNEQTLFAAPTDPTGFEPGNSFQRMVGWGNDGAFNPVHFYHHQQQQQQQQQQAMMPGHGPAFSQRGTLQSSFFQSVRAWNDLAMVPADHSRTTQDFHHQSLVFGTRFAPDGLSSGFAVPARIHGEDEQSQSVVSDGQPSSSSPVSQQ